MLRVPVRRKVVAAFIPTSFNRTPPKQHQAAIDNKASNTINIFMSSCCSESSANMNQNTFLDTFKSGGKRFATLVADTGAKTMLKTDVVFLERDIKNRKHAFGIQIYDILQSNSKASSSDTVFSASDEIQKAFEECKLDIETLEKKIDKKREEMGAIGDEGHGSAAGGEGGDGESASGRNAELESGILPTY